MHSRVTSVINNQKIAIITLVPDTGHTTSLLHFGRLLQDNGAEVHFFGPHENALLCQENNITSTTFLIRDRLPGLSGQIFKNKTFLERSHLINGCILIISKS